MGCVTPRSKNPPLARGREHWTSTRPCVSPLPPPRYSPITPGARSRSETAGGHSPAPPLRPAPPFRALQPCRITQSSGDFREETGGGEGEVPRGTVYRARPSHPGVPAGNHEWEPREAPTLHGERSGQRLHFPPRPLGVTAAARLSRRGRQGEEREPRGGAGAASRQLQDLARRIREVLPSFHPQTPCVAWRRPSYLPPPSWSLEAATQPTDSQ